MARPITWRNVAGPDFSGSAEILGQAQKSLGGAFDALRDTKDTYEEGRTDRNTQAFMDQLQQYGSSEELAQAQQAGDLQELRSGFGSMIDQNKVSADAVRDRVTSLRGRENADYTHEQQQMDQAEKPLVGDFSSRIAKVRAGDDVSGNFDQIRADLQASADSEDMRSTTAAKLLRTIDGRQNNLTQRQRNNEEHGRKTAKRDRAEAADSLVTNAVRGFNTEEDTVTSGVKSLRESFTPDMTSAERSQAETMFKQRVASTTSVAEGDQKYVNRANASVDRKYNLKSNIFTSYDPENAQQGVDDLVDKYTTGEGDDKFFMGIGNSKKREKKINQLRTMASGGIETGSGETIPVPTRLLNDVVASARDNGLIWNSVGDLETMVLDKMESPLYQEQYGNHLKGIQAKNQIQDEAYSLLSEGQPENMLKNLGLPEPTQPNYGEDSPVPAEIPQIFKPGSVNDGAGASFGRSVSEGASNMLGLVGDDIAGNNDFSLLGTLNPTAEGSAAKYLSDSVSNWGPIFQSIGQFGRGAVTSNIASSEVTEAVGRVKSSIDAGEQPSQSDMDATLKLMAERPELFNEDAIKALTGLNQ